MHTVSLADDQSHILIIVSGDIDTVRALRINQEAHALGRAHGIHFYLMDVTQSRNVQSATRNFYFAYDGMRQTPGLDLHAKVAMVVAPNDSSHDFVAEVARSAHLDVTLFRDHAQALAYLHEAHAHIAELT